MTGAIKAGTGEEDVGEGVREAATGSIEEGQGLELSERLEVGDSPAASDVSGLSDDDFGDFEETGKETVSEAVPSATSESESVVAEPVESRPARLTYDGDYESHAELIQELVDRMMKSLTVSEKTAANSSQIELNERCKDLYYRLVEQPANLQQINWKQSFIRRQLLLNLQIPINLDEVSPSKEGHSSVSNIYGDQDGLQLIEAEVLRQVQPFESLKIDEEGRKKVLKETGLRIEELYSQLQPFSYYKGVARSNEEELGEHLGRLAGVKEELLKILACWDKELEEDRKDNEVFSGYVENLVGNTQKMRRERRTYER
ncbi:DEKNAAC104310 [Brettanomyces naardenensis]|uniref:DEKNAAC104310 n=1 Tax=Brettanomyces naardenensis TaxID=13370 RepID=A0A448YQR7_BRENA|nr:DEKNAAC104310 [Brettanomyces naardenensis]